MTRERFDRTTVQVIRGLLPYLRPYAPVFATALALIVVATAIDVGKPALIGKTVDLAVAGSRDALVPMCLGFLALVLFEFGVDALKSYLFQQAGQRVTHDLRVKCFSRVGRLPVPYYDRNPVGRILTRIINDIKTLGEVFSASISLLVLDVILIAGTMAAMLWLHWRLALAVLAGFPLVLLAIHFFGKALAGAYRNARAKLSEINAFLGENIGAIATIQRLAAQGPRFEKFRAITEEHFEAQIKSLRVYANLHPITNTMNGIAMTTLLLVGGHWAIEGGISLGLLVAFIGYIRNLFDPVRDLVEKYNQLLSARVSGERVLALLDEPVEMDREAPPPSLGIERQIPDLEFRHVTFTYPGRARPALEDVSFRLEAGRSLAVVGPTGSGKSTLIRLLMRFYDFDDGDILVDGKSIREWDRAELRRLLGVVHQEIYLLEGTLRENLTLGSERPDGYLVEKCRQAQLWELVAGRGGLDMEVHEGGNNLSIGEKQLVALARILVFDPPVLILDEATASVDRILERKLMAAIRETIADRTSIVIAHRLSTIEACDHVLMLENGRVSQRRRHPAADHFVSGNAHSAT